MNNFAIIAHHDIGARNKPTKSSRMKRVNAFRKELLKCKICFSEQEVKCEDLPPIFPLYSTYRRYNHETERYEDMRKQFNDTKNHKTERKEETFTIFRY